MKKVTKIMVAIDFSEHSIAAAQYAAGLASDVGAALLLTNVINRRDVDLMEIAVKRVAVFSAEKYLEEKVESRKKRFEDLIKKLNLDNLNLETNVRMGVPFREILSEIKENKPDLLVMGRKGRSELADIVIGSCAQKLFRRCSIPLLTI
jgi:nucleotide-binding universal stress UspA family protein